MPRGGSLTLQKDHFELYEVPVFCWCNSAVVLASRNTRKGITYTHRGGFSELIVLDS